MTVIQTWAQTPLMQALGGALVHFLWQGRRDRGAVGGPVAGYAPAERACGRRRWSDGDDAGRLRRYVLGAVEGRLGRHDGDSRGRESPWKRWRHWDRWLGCWGPVRFGLAVGARRMGGAFLALGSGCIEPAAAGRVARRSPGSPPPGCFPSPTIGVGGCGSLRAVPGWTRRRCASRSILSLPRLWAC